jgi:lysophospholipase L1-like esterase
MNMKIAFYGDSLTAGITGVSYIEVLRKCLPDHTLINYGKGGDTVISLYRRIVAQNLLAPVDLIVLWIGVNDVFVNVSWTYPIIKRLEQKPWAKTPEEFAQHYRLILDRLCPLAKQVATVPPLFVGEDIQNRWNQELDRLSGIIRELSASRQNVDYLDLRTIAISRLASKPISPYVGKSAARIVLDAVTLRGHRQIDRKSAERGLHFTLDGVHLNSAGAELVAEAFWKVITA